MSKKERIIKIIIFISIMILIVSTFIQAKLPGGDEMWNYSFANNIVKGLIPYKDFNVVIPPFSFLLNSIFLRIHNSLFAYRCIYLLYYLLFMFLFDKVLTKLKIKDFWKYLLIIIAIVLLLRIEFVEYNFIQEILSLFIVYFSLNNKDYKNKKLNIITPVLVGITITNKQNTGVFIALAYMLLLLFNKKFDIKFIIKQALLISIPLIIVFIYLVITGSLYDFIDLCIFGMSTFNNRMYDYSLICIIFFFVLFICITIYINRKDHIYRILFAYSIATLLVSYPIFDFNHIILGLLLPSIYIINHLNKILFKFKYYYLLLLVPIFLYVSYNNINTYRNSYIIKEGPYKYISTTKSFNKVLTSVDNYILKNKDKKVMILSHGASVYKVNLGLYDKYFDLFNQGNFGKKGINEIYKIIDNEDYIYLIDRENIIWITPKEYLDYVEKTYYECDNIESFKVYCKNKN